jgi:preprotein translocase subunit SecD
MPTDADRTDGELLSAVVAGDGGAFATFCRRHLSTVVAFLLQETGDREAYIDDKQFPDRISGANGAEIVGSLTRQSVRNLAILLRYGPLPVNLTATG